MGGSLCVRWSDMINIFILVMSYCWLVLEQPAPHQAWTMRGKKFYSFLKLQNEYCKAKVERFGMVNRLFVKHDFDVAA